MTEEDGGPNGSRKENDGSQQQQQHDSSDAATTGSTTTVGEEESTDNLNIMPEDDFLLKIRQYITAQEPFDLSGYHVILTKGAIRLKGRDQLVIRGGIIEGAIHSLFQIDGDKKQNPRRLFLHNTTLRHTKTHNDPREIGAAIFAMGSSEVNLDGCNVSSKGGFAIWAKHRCSIDVNNCRIHNVARTAVACFNSVRVTVRNTIIDQYIGIHGVCGRGNSAVILQNVTLDQCQVRAVMVYQGGSITLEDCVITNTKDPTTPTIHAQGPPVPETPVSSSLDKEKEEGVEGEKGRRKEAQNDNTTTTTTTAGEKIKGTIDNTDNNNNKNGDKMILQIPSLRMIRCKVTNSEGPPLLLEGQVHEDLVDNEITS